MGYFPLIKVSQFKFKHIFSSKYSLIKFSVVLHISQNRLHYNYDYGISK